MPKYATKYEILRGVSPTSLTPCTEQPISTSKPKRVVFLLDEKKLLETGGLMTHHDTVFYEDSSHDWDWRNGKFYYYGHAMGHEDVGDIVLVYEETENAPLPVSGIKPEQVDGASL